MKSVRVPMAGDLSKVEEEFQSRLNGQEPMTRLITKIKANGLKSEYLINYDVPNDHAKGGFFSSSFPCNEEPRQEFFKALNLLCPLAIAAIGLDKDAWEKSAVIGLTFKWGKNDKEEDRLDGITITVMGNISDRYVCPTTPYLHIDDITEYQEDLSKVVAEAIAYLDGARRQQSLSFTLVE